MCLQMRKSAKQTHGSIHSAQDSIDLHPFQRTPMNCSGQRASSFVRVSQFHAAVYSAQRLPPHTMLVRMYQGKQGHDCMARRGVQPGQTKGGESHGTVASQLNRMAGQKKGKKRARQGQEKGKRRGEAYGAVATQFLARHSALAVDGTVAKDVLLDECLLNGGGRVKGDKAKAARHACAVGHNRRVLDLPVLRKVRLEVLARHLALHRMDK